MNTINRNNNISFISVISKIRKCLGDENLFFTFVVVNRKQNTEVVLTFGRDNISFIDNWMLLMEAKFASGSVDFISCVFRRFLKGDKNKIDFITKNKTIKIPNKELYHIGFLKNKINFFDEKETYEMQNTDCKTLKPMEAEKGIICMGSEILFDELFNKKYNVDKIYDKINTIGIENITDDEKTHLKNSSVK